jgi:hypothetical protein
MGSSAEDQALPDVLGRLHAREAQRAAEAAKRLEALQGSADPRESIEVFIGAFTRQRQALEASLLALQASGPVSAADPAAGDSLAADIAMLDQVGLLPCDSLQNCNSTWKALRTGQTAFWAQTGAIACSQGYRPLHSAGGGGCSLLPAHV